MLLLLLLPQIAIDLLASNCVVVVAVAVVVVVVAAVVAVVAVAVASNCY